MKYKSSTKVLSILLSLVMVLSLLPGMSLTAYAAEPINLSTLTGNYTANLLKEAANSLILYLNP